MSIYYPSTIPKKIKRYYHETRLGKQKKKKKLRTRGATALKFPHQLAVTPWISTLFARV